MRRSVPPSFITFCRSIPLDARLTKRLWGACQSCHSDSRVQTFLFGLEHCISAETGDQLYARHRHFSHAGPGRPAALVELLELFVVHNRLTRDEANLIEEQLLRDVDAEGKWKGIL